MLTDKGFFAKIKPASKFAIIPRNMIDAAVLPSKSNGKPITKVTSAQPDRFATSIAIRLAPAPTIADLRVKLSKINELDAPKVFKRQAS